MAEQRYRVGILGGGQLARMSMIAAHRLGVSAISLDEDPDSPAAQVGPFLQGSIHDEKAIAELMNRVDFVTFENEFIRAETLRNACELASFDPKSIVPGIDSLEVIQDKFLQRQAYANQGVPTPKAVDASKATALGFPCVLKARYGGYDGKGTAYAKTIEDYDALRPVWEQGGWLAEEFVPFVRELAVMVVTTRSGYTTFPVVETVQTNHVCDLVFPVENEGTIRLAQKVAVDAVKAVNGSGLYGVELFELKNGEVSVNEIAPRPHNTGHYTLDWGGTSQFEAHILSVIGELSEVHPGIPTCMANILGVNNAKDYNNALSSLSEHPAARMHWYGKRAAKPGRKMGHLNVCGVADIKSAAVEARRAFYEGWTK